MLDYSKLCRSKELEFWSKAWPFAVAGTYILGLLLLNFYFLCWGFIDLGLSSTQCVAAALIGLLVVGSAKLLNFVGNVFVEWISNGKRWRRVIIGIAMLCVGAFYVISQIFANRLDSLMQSHLPKISTELGRAVIALVTFLAIVYLLMILTILWPVKTNSQRMIHIPITDEGARSWRTLVRFSFRALLAPAMVCLVGAGFLDVYSVIPAGYGGGAPDPVLLWISPNDLPAFGLTRINQHDTICSSSSLVVYRGLKVVHEGSDYLTLIPEDSDELIYLSKDVAKRRLFVGHAKKRLLDEIKPGINNVSPCISMRPSKQPQRP